MNNTIGIERNANLDLFRVFSMILIIFIHSIDHSGVLDVRACDKLEEKLLWFNNQLFNDNDETLIFNRKSSIAIIGEKECMN